ncbi:MAG TPA: NAD(P)-dependent alcohol dehydrogenase [Terriglobales bacterium]|nr:NAD(P)-dependent alcohol dehydrogenase [Terriglobales bacterium]
MSKDRMRGWVMTGYGRENLNWAELPMPQAGQGEVLVKVAAVSLNYRDRLVVENGMGNELDFPFTPGSDLAGEVVATGAGVTRFKAGDRVISHFTTGWQDGELTAIKGKYGLALGAPLLGVLGSYVAIPQDWLVAAPESLDAVEASTLPIAGLTAWFSLIELGHLKAGETVLVQGTGGVALFGAQLAAAHGADVVVTSSSADKLARLQKLLGEGVRFHGIERQRHAAWGEEAVRLTNGRGVDHLLEMAAGDLTQSMTALKIGGRLSAIGIINGYDYNIPAFPLLVKNLTVKGIFVGHRRALQDLVRAVDRLKLKPIIDKVYDAADLPAALDHLERGPFGKLVVRFPG